jgi:hypothetical protein
MKIAGTKVVDANKKINLRITKRDCSTGSLKDPSACAAAKALCRLSDVKECRVHIARVYIKTKDKWVRYATPPSLRSEIIAFDRGGTFAPGDYPLAPVQPTVRLGAKPRKRYDYSKGPRHGKPQGKRSKPHVVKGIRSHGGTERQR